MTTRVLGVVLLAMAIAVSRPLAQAPAALLVDVAWLDQHLNDDNLILLHVGGAEDYAAGHIPGARRIVEEDVALPHDHRVRQNLMLELPAAAVLRDVFAARGVSDDSRIVVYAGGDVALPSATRILFTLDYLGLGDRSSVLDGGIGAWRGAKRPLATASAVASRGTLRARATSPVVVDAAFVATMAKQPGQVLVDARAPVFYHGLEPTFDKQGHIPGAINVPFTAVSGSDLRIDRAGIAEVFRQAGIRRGQTLVVYCHVGQQATAVIFAARLLGYRALLYDGAFQDWAVNSRGSVER